MCGFIIFNNQNLLKRYKIQLQFILVLSKTKIVDSTYKPVILKINRTAVVFDRVLSVRHEASVHVPRSVNHYLFLWLSISLYNLFKRFTYSSYIEHFMNNL